MHNIGNSASHDINFTNANMTGSDIQYADLSSSDLTGANFTNANMHFTHLNGASLLNTNLTGANLDNTFFNDANLTGATVTQAQLAIAFLTSGTICPDGYTLGVHTGDCFSPLAPRTPVLIDGGFTFTVTNYNEEYTYTAIIQTGVGNPTIGSPSGSNLPIVVTGVPAGSSATVIVTATIGSVSASASVSNETALANTGGSESGLINGALVLLVLGMLTLLTVGRQQQP